MMEQVLKDDVYALFRKVIYEHLLDKGYVESAKCFKEECLDLNLESNTNDTRQDNKSILQRWWTLVCDMTKFTSQAEVSIQSKGDLAHWRHELLPTSDELLAADDDDENVPHLPDDFSALLGFENPLLQTLHPMDALLMEIEEHSRWHESAAANQKVEMNSSSSKLRDQIDSSDYRKCVKSTQVRHSLSVKQVPNKKAKLNKESASYTAPTGSSHSGDEGLPSKRGRLHATEREAHSGKMQVSTPRFGESNSNRNCNQQQLKGRSWTPPHSKLDGARSEKSPLGYEIHDEDSRNAKE